MNDASTLTMMGLLCLIFPAILLFKQGARDDGDIAHWMAKIPFEKLVTIQGMVLFAFLLLAAGALRGMEWTLLSR